MNDLSVQDMLLFVTARQAAMLEEQRQLARASVPQHPPVQPWDRLVDEAIATAWQDVARFRNLRARIPDS